MTEGAFIGGCLCVILGLLIILARVKRWSWFVDHYKVQRIEDAFGNKGADIFYISCGGVIIVLGILIALNILG